VLVASALDSSFSATPDSEFASQRIRKNVNHFGITGTWTELVSNLTNVFDVVAGTEYALQYQKKDPSTFEKLEVLIASGLDNTFSANADSEFASQRVRKNV